jgi:glycosyltransferase involved in cell wall biosynthesis
MPPRIAAEYDVGSSIPRTAGCPARNTGWQAATGQIVAYIDDDAYPDPHWLHYLAYRFMTSDCVAVGGPNIAPPGDDCGLVANAGWAGARARHRYRGRTSRHNMAFRREALEAVGGFDPRYRTAGDDVDVCWRLQERGGRIGFHAGAMDWHHRRNSIAMYWRQQKGYGKAEALLEENGRSDTTRRGIVWSGGCTVAATSDSRALSVASGARAIGRCTSRHRSHCYYCR